MSAVSVPGSTGVRDPLAALRSGRLRGEDARLRAATRLLEGTFYQELFKAMRETIPDGGAVETSAGQEAFTEMLDQHVSDAAAMKATRGIGQALYDHFARSLASAPSEPVGAHPSKPEEA